jgi:hypothetical protein
MRKIILLFFILFSSVGFSQTKGMFSYDPLVNLENFDKANVYWGYFLGFNSFGFKERFFNSSELFNSNSKVYSVETVTFPSFI